MDRRHKPFYCYMDNGEPRIVETRPENFVELPFHYKTHCPSLEIARLTYQTNLRIMQWRTAEY